MPDLFIHSLTPDRWDDFAELFGPRGAYGDCWCTYFRLPARQHHGQTGAEKCAFMRARVMAGPPPGLLGYRGDAPIAWMQIGPRADVPQWNSPRRLSSPLPDALADDPAVWAISCFFTKRSERGNGLSHWMVEAGIAHARASGARVLEACPMDRSAQSKSASLYVGSTAVFLRAGFRKVAEKRAGRPLMRLDLAV